jgi:hypothetical protein
MQNFNWNSVGDRDLSQRYDSDIRGHSQWQALVQAVKEAGERQSGSGLELYQAFDDFLESIARLPPLACAAECRVFVSHRRADLFYAECIAEIAAAERYGYWLDVEDPILKFAGGPSIQSPARELLIAGAIEIALINVTHLVAVMTVHTQGSKWVPYEIGRARQRLLYSPRSAVWLEPNTPLNNCGEYVHLGRITNSKRDIEDWLSSTQCRARHGSMDCCALNTASFRRWDSGARILPERVDHSVT